MEKQNFMPMFGRARLKQTCHNKEDNLAKLDDGLNKSPTVMVGEAKHQKQLGKNRGILKPIWAIIETKRGEIEVNLE